MLNMGIEPDSNCASKGIGYRQAMLFLKQCHDDESLASAKGLVRCSTARFSAGRNACGDCLANVMSLQGRHGTADRRQAAWAGPPIACDTFAGTQSLRSKHSWGCHFHWLGRLLLRPCHLPRPSMHRLSWRPGRCAVRPHRLFPQPWARGGNAAGAWTEPSAVKTSLPHLSWHLSVHTLVLVCMQLQMVADMQTRSRQLSKSQLSWFRGDPMYQWVDAGRALDDIVDEIIASVQMHQHPGQQHCFSDSQTLETSD